MTRTALVTGANRGIGLETARELARRGFHVVIASRDEASGCQATKEIEPVGGSASYLSLDVSNSQSIREAASRFASISDRLDVLVNNAGIYPDEGVTISTVPRHLVVQAFQTNTFGALEVAQALLPYLRHAKSSRIINVSSGYGQVDGMSADAPSYCLSKLALNGVTIMLAEALRADGIAVNSMCPGWVRTDMGGASATRSVEEGADTVVWLADEASHKVTGKIFRDRQELPW
jgi:NAD(P)-dependent dehydrogenase (short-subunit alcohol dehydrogenase family)